MRRVHRRSFVPTVAVPAVAVVIVALATCGGGSPGDRGAVEATIPLSRAVDDQTLGRALEATRSVESGRVEVATTVTGLVEVPDPPPGGRVTVAVHRVAFDRRTRRVDVETDMSGAAAALGPGDTAARGDLSGAARMVAVDDVVYAQGGPLAAAVGREPTDWVEVDRATFVEQEPHSDAAALLLDPLGPFEVLRDAATHVRLIGDDDIRGSPTTHLAGSAGSAPVDVWVDTDGVIRRLEMRLAGRVGSGAGELVTTIELFDIGQPVDIAPPGGER